MNPSPTSSSLTALITERLRANQPVRRRIPGIGRLHIDRQLPFLAVHRRPGDHPDLGTHRLITGEASYLLVTEPRPDHAALTSLATAIVQTLTGEFGAFLLCEVWTAPPDPDADPAAGHIPSFRVHAVRTQPITATLEVLQTHLEKIRIQRQPSTVEVMHGDTAVPPGLPPLLTARQAREANSFTLALEVTPVFRSADGETLYPLLLRTLRRGLSRALKRTFHHFSGAHTTHTPPSYMALGRRAVVKAVWQVDEQLAAISDSFDFLLQVTPINIESSWSAFRRSQFKKIPPFLYRPRPIDPALVKRRLFRIPIERVEDPTLEQLFREKQEELDCQLSMLLNRDTRRFLHGSLQLYGDIDPSLVERATQILTRLPPQRRESTRGQLDSRAFARLAREEVDRYSRICPDFSTIVQVRDDIYAGLMVSQGNLLIGKNTLIPRRRAEALLCHEIGTHALTYHNGHAQPFHQLHVGLAGYEELQEGLAVLAEHLVGGLSPARLRLLAARVLAAHSMVQGADFAEVFRLLHRTHGFTQRTAFTVSMRIFRGGGLTKDTVYLRGLLRVWEHLRQGGEIEPLYIGKIGAHHLPLIRELRWRRVLRPAPLRPTFLDRQDCRARIEHLRTVVDLVQLAQSATHRKR